MAIRQLFTEQQYGDGFYDPFSADEGFLRQVVSAPTPAPPPVLSAPPAPALVAAPPPAPVIAAPAPAPVIAALAPAPVLSPPAAPSIYKFDPSTLGEAQQYFSAPNVDRETWEALLREQEVAREMPAERYDRFSYRDIPKIVPEDYESWVQQQYLQASNQAREALRNRQTDDLTSYFSSQWGSYGIDPSIKGINRANELAQILAHYGITDLSQLGLKTSPFEEMRMVGDDYGVGEELYRGTRGQITYGDRTYGRLGGVGSKGQRGYLNTDPLEFLQDYGDQGYLITGSAAGKGSVDYILLKDAQGNLRRDAQGRPVIVPQWRSTSDAGKIAQLLAFAAIPFTGGLSSALANAGLGAVGGQVAAQALISGGLGGLSAVGQGESFGSGFGKGALTGGLTAGIGSFVAPAANAVSSSVLDATKSQVLADIASGAIKGGAGALPGAIMSGDFGNVLTGALTGGVGSGVSSGLENVKFSDTSSVNNAIIQGAGDLAAAATRAAVTGQDLNVVNALLPAVAQGISEEYKLPVRQVTAGLQVANKLLQGGDLSPTDILRLGTAFTSSGTKPAAGKEASAGYGGADAGGFFDSEEAQNVEDDIQSILARYSEAAPAPQQVEVSAPAPAPAPTVQDFIDQIAREEEVYAIPQYEPAPITPPPPPPPPPEQVYEVAAPAPAPYFPEFEEPFPVYTPEPPPTPAQQVEVAAPLPPAAFDLPEEVLSSLSPAPQPRPISELERVLFQEANVMPDTAQQVVTTGDKQEPLLPELPETVVPPPAPEEPRYIDVTEGQPQQVEITGGGQSLGNLLADLGLVTKLPETPVIPPEDIPAIVAPPVTPPTIPAPAPAAPPAAAPATPSPAAPAPAPAPKRQDDLALLMMLAAMMTPQQKEEEQYQLAQILGVDSPFGRIV